MVVFLFELFVLAVVGFLLTQVVLPLFIKRPFFWFFRQDEAERKRVVEDLNSAEFRSKTEEIKKKTEAKQQ